MCGICGFCAFDRNNGTPAWRETGHRMGETLNHRGPDDKGLWQGNDCVLVHRRLSVMDPSRGQQPMIKTMDGADYVLVYNGELYNAPNLRRELEAEGFSFDTTCDTEVLLYALIAWGEAAPEKLEGIFAFVFWDGARQRMLCCRDRFGVKPFFYAWRDGAFVFASELKALFEYPGLEPRLGPDGLREVLGIGPARTAGVGVFQGIEELPPAALMVLTPGGAAVRRYWELASRPHEDDYATTVERVRELVTGAIRRQLVSDVPLCTFLSGGLDSSIITAEAAQTYTEEGRPALETYSFDYVGNEKFFHTSAFQPDTDAPYAKQMADAFHTRHRVLQCDIPSLSILLEEAMAARDLPGMADVDSSLLYFCRQVAKEHVVALSGECADEVFGGYPWFEREDMLSAGTFPWCPDLSPRREIFDRALWTDLQVEDYIRGRYEQSLAACPRLEGERPGEARRREVGWLSIHWFMACLLERKDRMSMASGLEVRVPFCDHHLVEYVWNIPYAMKAMNGQRKQVLRDAARGLLPESVRARPKSPYPKTHDPLYEQMVRAKLAFILDDPGAPIHSLVDAKALQSGLMAGAGDYGRPWFGQLMAGPQMLAYLIQINAWMARFHLSI
ncbi:MAG: asparagine synthase (glutamine-hydrolyzing) [Lawsonibacter sp.]|nr:asparagine synthase (glutamine-hydrolyzing) [Lawsonibacter sp.]